MTALCFGALGCAQGWTVERIFLGVLSPSGNPKVWAEELSKQRTEYYERYEEFKVGGAERR